jgi:hypothetical protein
LPSASAGTARSSPPAARFSPAEHRAIADWIAATTEALVADTQRVMSLDQGQSTVRSK